MDKIPGLGELRHRLVFQSLSSASDDQGGIVETWGNYATLWGKLEPTGAREVQFAQAIQYRRTHKAWIRNTSEYTITTSMRVSFDSRTFQVKGIRRPDERRFFLLIDLEENVGT